jgi:hypothetical protein
MLTRREQEGCERAHPRVEGHHVWQKALQKVLIVYVQQVRVVDLHGLRAQRGRGRKDRCAVRGDGDVRLRGGA